MGLVQYDSDEDSDEQMQVDAQPQPAAQKPVNPAAKVPNNKVPAPSQPHASVAPEPSAPNVPQAEPQNDRPQPEPAPGPQLPPAQGPVLGPTLGPQPPPPPTQPFSEVDMSFLETSLNNPPNDDPSEEPPKSPYTAQRTLLRDLTLPAIDISTLDIPPSPPPSSPSQSSHLTALNTKFDDFLRLKRTKNVHFNQRLATSSMLSNPSLMDKMLGFVGLESEFLGPDDVKATEQYMTTLSPEIWDPTAFPGWAYKGMLRKSQERVGKERERGKGEVVQFVGGGVVGGGEVLGGLSTTGSGSAPGSRSGTPGLGGGTKRKSRFDA